MKSNFSIAVFIAGLIFFSGCNSTQITATYKSPDAKSDYSKIFVVGLVGDQLTQKNIENDLVKMLRARGIDAAAKKGTFDPKMELSEEKKREIAKSLENQGYDSVITFALVSVDEKKDYVPGSYSSVGVGYYPTRSPYYGSYWGYYGHYSTQVYQPGYYTNNTIYTMEAVLYDLGSEELVWSARSETMNPSSVNSFSREYAETVAYRLLKDRVVQPKR